MSAEGFAIASCGT